MSNAVLPVYPGQDWNVRRTPVWSTTEKRSVSGRRYAYANWSYPIWRYTLSFNVLRARSGLPEMQAVAGFFNARQGSFDTFLFSDPDDNSVVLQQIGIGDGVTTSFQLVRGFGTYVEPVLAPDAGTAVFRVGSVVTAGTLDTSTGIVTFASPPASGAPVRWTGGFYWRCHFTKDMAEFNQFMKQLWELKSFEFETEKL